MIYKLREWLRDEDFYPYVEESERDSQIESLNEMEEWLYEDGADAKYTVYQEKEKNLTALFNKYNSRKDEAEARPELIENTKTFMNKIMERVQEWNESKPWITEEEKKDVFDKIDEFKKWLDDQVEEQGSKPTHEDPLFTQKDVRKKASSIKKLFEKVKSKKRPDPP